MGTIKQPKERYRKGTRVSEEGRLGNINKKELLKNELPKGDPRGVIAKLLRVVSLAGEEPILLLPSLNRPC